MGRWGWISALALALIFGVQALHAAPREEARAHWLKRDLIAWAPGAPGDPVLVANGAAVATLTPAGSVSGALAEANPHLRGLPLFRLNAPRERVITWLKGAVRVALPAPQGRIETGLQIGGVLDDLFANDDALGVRFDHGVPTLGLWAPTARNVRLHLFAGPRGGRAKIVPMREDARTGIWRVRGAPGWNRRYYLYEVSVFVPAEGRVVNSLVTDPYALALARDSARVQILNLADADLKPAGWDGLRAPLPEAPEDRAIYELHVRDFSIGDASVPPAHRGKYRAFADQGSQGMRHLRALAAAGLSDIHLLPTYDCATVPENPADQRTPGDLTRLAADSEAQQAAVMAVRDQDAFNWCYDPFHYLAPEGSYAITPDGGARVREFREMVMGLRAAGLGTILDVVFNHTVAAGLARGSVLDRIVPGYYHRLDAAGKVERSTCCANTASERAMMEKLMIDALMVWARDYKVAGFRFDLMGHHSRATILKARDRLRGLTLARDGVDGANLYLYGEGWNFGEVADDARFVQATQRHMGEGTGVGTFNDRFRDAIRGGGAGDSGAAIVRAQGFASGLGAAPNAPDRDPAADAALLRTLADHIRVGLAGSLADYPLPLAEGGTKRAGDLPYGNAPLGYVSDPQETINYAEAHDNETLFDVLAYKLPPDTMPAERVRWQNLAASLVILAQGVPFLQAGQDLLRSKSLDRNSHDSGDWFNRLDWSMAGNGWAGGLPPKPDNGANWPIARPLLAKASLKMSRAEIGAAAAQVRELLQIRRATAGFRLRTGAAVIDRLRFHDVGGDRPAGLIVMSIAGADGAVLVVNATRREQRIAAPLPGRFALHPVQRASADPIVRQARVADGAMTVPPLTTAVFVPQ